MTGKSKTTSKRARKTEESRVYRQVGFLPAHDTWLEDQARRFFRTVPQAVRHRVQNEMNRVLDPDAQLRDPLLREAKARRPNAFAAAESYE